MKLPDAYIDLARPAENYAKAGLDAAATEARVLDALRTARLDAMPVAG